MSRGQITLPRDIRTALKLNIGDHVTLICEGEKVILMNTALYAMRRLQKEMEGEAQNAGIFSDDDVVKLIMEMRDEDKE